MAKFGLRWIIKNRGEDFERWVMDELRSEEDPSRSTQLRSALRIIEEARRAPAGFVEKLEQDYEAAVALHREYERHAGGSRAVKVKRVKRAGPGPARRP